MLPETAALVIINYDMLADFIGLPPGVEIMRVSDEGYLRAVRVALRGPGLPLAEEGKLLPEVLLRVKRDPDGRYKFDGWEERSIE